MKNLFKKLTKVFSLILVVAVGFISITACSNKNTVASEQIPENSTQISDSVETKEPVADEVTDKDESKEEQPVSPETPVSTFARDIFGFYKFTDKLLSYDDIYFYDINEALTFFETRDINGIYDIIERLNFNEFAKNLTTISVNSSERDLALVIGGDESTKEYSITTYYYDVYDRYFWESNSLYSDIDFTIENDIIITPKNSLNLEFNSENDILTAYFQFFYIDENSGERVYTPLYIKTILESELDMEPFTKITDAASIKYYEYKEGSAVLNSNNSFTDTAKLAEILMLDEDEILDIISSCILYFDEDKSHLLIGYDEIVVTAIKADNANKYLVYNSFYLNVVNEQVDFTTDTTTLNFEIEIDENSSFTFSYKLTEFKYVEGIPG